MRNFLDMMITPAVARVQDEKGSRAMYADYVAGVGPDAFDDSMVELITTRDSIYMATVTEDGWPYVQHRGGAPGFISVLDGTTIGWIERTGNRQYLGTGNITANGRVSIIAVDYPTRRRLKLLGVATHHPRPDARLLEALDGSALRSDGAITIDVIATAWNCPKYITPRYTIEEIAEIAGTTDLAALR